MENKINIAELLKDCPKGMELDCTICNNVVTLECVDTVGYYPIRVMSKDGFHHILTSEGCVYKREDAKCVIFPKGKTTWEGFQRPFMDGDVVATTNGLWIGITTGGEKGKFIPTYCVIRSGDEFKAYPDRKGEWAFNRLATEEEKKKLFDAIKENGYKWNPETKTLEKLEQTWTIQDAKDGDVLAFDDETIVIFKDLYNNTSFHSYCHIEDGIFTISKEDMPYWWRAKGFYPATEEQCTLLFRKIKEAGYHWNAETKTLEKLIEPKFKVGDKIKHKDSGIYCTLREYSEGISAYRTNIGLSITCKDLEDWELVPNKFDIDNLKPFDRVLVRHNIDNKWCGSFFSHIDDDLHSHCYKYVTIAGKSYPMCIPYEKNEHLLGTTDDCNEYFKTW